MRRERKIKVIWLYSHLLFWTGGTRFVLEVTKRLQTLWDVKVIVEKASPEIKREFKQYGVEVREIGVLTSTSLIYWLFFPVMFKVHGGRIRKATYDADIVISGMFPMNAIASLLDKPTIQNCWEPFAFFHDKEMINGFSLTKRMLIQILAILYTHLDMRGTQNSDVITTLNHSTEEWNRKIYGRGGVKTYMGVDAEFFRPVPVLPSRKNGKKIILHSTDYTLMKGTKYLIEALPLVIDKVGNLKIIITHTVENKKQRENLFSRAKEIGVDKYMEFAGTVPFTKLPEYYSLADLVVFTGHPESIGTTASMTVLEAMACETPVVRSIGCTEEVEDGVSGVLVDPRDKVKLADAIIKILLNEDMARKMAKEGRRRACMVYNWDNTCKIFSDVIESLIDNKCT